MIILYVFMFLELHFDVSCHGDMNISVVVVPFKCDSTIQSTNPINFHLVNGLEGF